MIPLLLVAALSWQEGIEGARRALQEDDYCGAWAHMESETDPVLRARMESEILYQAGDPARALAAARAGLERSPQQLELLYHAAGAAIWLQDASLAEALSSRLSKAVQLAQQLSSQDREGWERVARDFTERSDDLRKHALSRASAVTRARVLAIAGLLVGVVLSSLAASRVVTRSSGKV